ncbi:MAG: hypothetical protein KA717_14355 [Woronichinia naegeliana WA131]|jgi:hypothetical protein|uniref:Uncharacterized protein n=1 Tax=Woronichinia naegeliana WA131 TaxID=2824559 RepID=A0A977L1A6_9CYAN|nr:MAG: hypothetical protein KA717_14355 [Woronichinia naegeliana WA131]
MPEENQADYRFIWEKLVVQQSVESEERLWGMLAYAKYKLEKDRWFTKIPNPSREQIDAFHALYDDEKLNELMRSAQQILLDYAEEYAEAELQEQLGRYKNEVLSTELQGVKSELTQEIKKTRINLTNLFLPIVQSIVASIIFAIGLFGIALLVRFLAPDSNPGQLIKFFFASEQYKLCVIDKTKTDGVDTKKCFP